MPDRRSRPVNPSTPATPAKDRDQAGRDVAPEQSPRRLLRQLFDAAIAAAQPALCVPPYLPAAAQIGGARLIVIGAGKASAAMAQAVEAHYQNDMHHFQNGLEGLVITRYGYAVPCTKIEIIEAAHPVPDQAGLHGAQRMLAMVQQLQPQDWVLCLISGGGSALLPLPAPGLTLEDKQNINRALLRSGASIGEMNCVRRHLSAIKGGRLAAACHPAHLLTLLMSDVPGDKPIDIASGPTVPDPTTCADALAIIARYRIAIPVHARQWLEGAAGESIKPTDPRLQSIQTHIVTAPQRSLEAAAQVARQAGYGVHILGDALEGEARDMGKVLAGIALQVAQRGQPFEPPCVLLSGGEATVTLPERGEPRATLCTEAPSEATIGATTEVAPECLSAHPSTTDSANQSIDAPSQATAPGSGGRNVECLLSMGISLGGHPNIYALAGDTDGVDGSAEIAGAHLAPDTLARAFAMGIRPTHSLDRNDGHGFFQALGDSIVTGPTRTNVNDFRAILITKPSHD